MTLLVSFVTAAVMVATPIASVVNMIMMLMLMLTCNYTNILKVNWCTETLIK